MSVTTAPNEVNKLMDSILNSFVLGLWDSIKIIWLSFWPYIIIFILFILAGIIWQIIKLRTDKRKKLSAAFNSLVGSLTYFLFFGLLFIIFYFIFGSRVVDKIWFAIFGTASFFITKRFLRWIGFWYY